MSKYNSGLQKRCGCDLMKKYFEHSRMILGIIFFIFIIMLSATCLAATVETEYIKIPAQIDGKIYNLDAKIYKPEGDGPFPLIVLTHGRHGHVSDGRIRTPDDYAMTAMAFEKMNCVVVYVVRRGYGKSDGPDAESFSGDYVDVYRIGSQGAKDIKGVVEYMKTKPYIDSSKIVLAGHSTGGAVVMAANCLGIPGVQGIINFSGGLGSRNTIGMLNAFERFGKEGKVPTLWFYARNDTFFDYPLQQQIYKKYSENGGRATFIEMEPSGTEGHNIIYEAIPQWLSYARDYLKAIGFNVSEASSE
ncbi:MAG: alpha/beta fold hydrolase [Veillonellales bacterium]